MLWLNPQATAEQTLAKWGFFVQKAMLSWPWLQKGTISQFINVGQAVATTMTAFTGKRVRFLSDLLNQCWLDSPVADPSSRRPGANKMGLLFSQKAMLSLAAKSTTNQIVHVGQARATTMTASAASQSWLDFPVADPSSRRPGANKMRLLFSQKASYAVPCCKMDNKPERPCRASNGYDDDCICRKDNGFLERVVEPILARFPSCRPQSPQTGR